MLDDNGHVRGAESGRQQVHIDFARCGSLKYSKMEIGEFRSAAPELLSPGQGGMNLRVPERRSGTLPGERGNE